MKSLRHNLNQAKRAVAGAFADPERLDELQTAIDQLRAENAHEIDQLRVAHRAEMVNLAERLNAVAERLDVLEALEARKS